MTNDIISAISTPPGEAGIAIVRTSGNGALALVNQIFSSYSGKDLEEVRSHSLTLGVVKDASGRIIDEVLVGVMKGPRSYTGEDVVEINCHGGITAARTCMALLIEMGARIAEPGEFTKRAFLNGRIDMVQAEAVIEVIRAKTEKALILSAKNLRGSLSKAVKQIEEMLIKVNSRLEASIDFPEEVGEPDWQEIKSCLKKAEDEIKSILSAGERLKIYREGIKVVIAGKPNVGKSSLLNVLTRKKRAIVTDIPGTTRDVIEEYVNINGIPVRLMDTAGIRETGDLIESIGVEKSLEAINEADAVVLVLDAETGITQDDMDVYGQVRDKNLLIVLNKIDSPQKKINIHEVKEQFSDLPVVEISAREEIGIDEFEKALPALHTEPKTGEDHEEIMVNARQEELLKQTANHIREAIEGIERNHTWDALAVDTWCAVSMLEELTGKTIKSDVIDQIFATFCIGK